MKAIKYIILILILVLALQGQQLVSQSGTTKSNSTSQTIKVPPVPPVPVLLRPPIGSMPYNPWPPWLVWLDSGAVTSYRVQLGPDSLYTTPYFDTTITTTAAIDSVRLLSLPFWQRYFWHVRATNASGSSNYSRSFYFYTLQVGVSVISSKAPGQFKLYDNYPNPFNPECTIRFDLPFAGDVKMSIYNVTGQEVAVPIASQMEAGTYSLKWDGTDFPSGIYFFRIVAGNSSDVKKMVLVK